MVQLIASGQICIVDLNDVVADFNPPISPRDGMVWFNQNDNKLYVYSNGKWKFSADGMIIGGINILKRTDFTDTTGWTGFQSVNTNDFQGVNSLTLTRTNWATGQSRTQITYNIPTLPLTTQGNQYTLSCWVYVDSSVALAGGNANSLSVRYFKKSDSTMYDLNLVDLSVVQKDTWVRVSASSTLGLDVLNNASFLLSISQNGKIKIAKPQLEIGNTMTDWRKAPEDTDDKISDIQITLGNMADDSKLDVTERQEIKNKLTPIIGDTVVDTLSALPTASQLFTNAVGEVYAIRKAAQNVLIANTDPVYVTLETKYNDLATYLNGMTPVKPWDASAANKDKTITIVPTDWRSKWLDYYKAYQTLNSYIAQKMKEYTDAGTSSESDHINKNYNFGDWTGTYPTGYSNYTGALPTKVTSENGNGNSVKFVNTLGQDSYLTGVKYSNKPFYSYIYVESTFKLESGSATGAGILFRYLKADGTSMLYDNRFKFTDVVPNPVLNKWYTVSKVFKVASSSDFSGYQVFPMGSFSSFDSVRPACTIYIDSVVTRPATSEEIKSYDSQLILNDIAADGKLTPTEKREAKKEWDSIVAEYPTISSQADTYTITAEKTSYKNAYDNLNTYITPLLADLTTTSDVVSTTFRDNFKQYYDTKAKLQKAITDASKGMIDNTINQSPNILLNSGFMQDNGTVVGGKYWNIQTGASVDKTLTLNGIPYVRSVQSGNGSNVYRGAVSTYYPVTIDRDITFSVYAFSPDITAIDAGMSMEIRGYDINKVRISAQTFGVSTKPTANNTWQRFSRTFKFTDVNVVYMDCIMYVTKNGTAYYAKPMIQYGSVLGNWSPNPSDFVMSDLDAKAEASKAAISDMTADAKLTPVEKQGLKQIWQGIVSEKAYYDALADSIKITTEKSEYGNAYTTLNNMLNNSTNGYLLNVLTTSDIDRAGLNTNVSTYYDKKAKLTKAINEKIQSNVDGIENGGRNLIRYTDFRKFDATKWTNWNPNTPSPSTSMNITLASGETIPFLVVRSIAGLAKSSAFGYVSASGTNNAYKFSLNAGQQYTLSFLVAVHGNALPTLDYTYIINDGGTNQKLTMPNVTTQKVYGSMTTPYALTVYEYSVTFVATYTSSTTRLLIGSLTSNDFTGGQSYGLFYVSRIQLEQGNKKTSWNPAPEDIYDKIDNNDNQIRQDLGMTAPLPTSILMDANGITAKTSDPLKYARLDYRGLYIAGGALQIEGGLTEQQLAQGVTKKISYLDSNGLYTGQVNLGGSNVNGILSVKDASNAEIVRADKTGLTINNGAITIKRPDGANFIQNGLASFDFGVDSHEPQYIGSNVKTDGWWCYTSGNGNKDAQAINYYSFKHTGRYLKFWLGYYNYSGTNGAVTVIANDGVTFLTQVNFSTTDRLYENVITVDLGIPTFKFNGVYLCIHSFDTGYKYLRKLRAWLEG